MGSCIFCDIAGSLRPSYTIYQDDTHMAFLDRYPVVPGHTLIIPRRHHATIMDMTPQEVGDLFSLVPHIASAVLAATGAPAFNVGQNNGDAAHQIVPHVHVHIIPRRPNESLNWSSRLVVADSRFAEMAGRIRNLV